RDLPPLLILESERHLDEVALGVRQRLSHALLLRFEDMPKLVCFLFAAPAQALRCDLRQLMCARLELRQQVTNVLRCGCKELLLNRPIRRMKMIREGLLEQLERSCLRIALVFHERSTPLG